MDNSLIVMENEADVADQISNHFENDYIVYKSNSDSQTLDTLKQSSVQLILIGQGATDLEGAEFISTLKDDYPEVMRVLLADQGNSKEAEKFVNNGLVHSVVSKPINLDELDQVATDGVRNYEKMSEIKKKIIQESADMIEKVNAVISQAKEFEKKKLELENQANEAKEEADRIKSETTEKIATYEAELKKIDVYEADLDKTKKELGTALAEKNRYEKKLQQFQENWNRVVGAK